MGALLMLLQRTVTLPIWMLLSGALVIASTAAGTAWKVQGWRLDAVKAEYSGFVATTKAQGDAAKKLAEKQKAEDQRLKEQKDHEYQTSLAALRADVKRLRDARARVDYVPAAPAGSSRPDLACFDRAQLERAIRQLDAGVSGLVAEGDEDAVGLNVARSWAYQVLKRE